MRRARTLAIVGLAALLLAGCGSAEQAAGPTWQPSNGAGEPPGGEFTPIIPMPSASGPGQPSGPSGGSGGAPSGPGSPSGSPSAGSTDPSVVATGLTAPVGLALLPDGSALVGERTTGRILRVQPTPGQPVPTVRTLTGLDATGDGGLLDLALSPTYAQDNLIYAYLTTTTDNRVVDFTLGGPVTPVLTGIPKGRTGNTGRLMFGRDGDLYVGTGDAGNPALAANPRSLAGKVLRVDDIGDPAGGTPAHPSPVWAGGLHDVTGLCTMAQTTSIFAVQDGAPGHAGQLDAVTANGNYGWPAPTAGSTAPAATLPVADGASGGCAILGGRVWIASLDGQRLLSAPLAPTGGLVTPVKFTVALAEKYGRLRTVVAASDGALWLTTSNRDGRGRPIPADERVIRYVPAAGGGGGSPV